ncbi:MAG: hypothetical protein Q9160_008347 [Pyrenula sp. 1 TL-2023]
MRISVSPFPLGHNLFLQDWEYYDALGRDPLQQNKIWSISDPTERDRKLNDRLQKYPKQRHFCQAEDKEDVGDKEKSDKKDIEGNEGEDGRKDENDESGFGIPDREDPSVVPLHAAAFKGNLGCVRIFIEGLVGVDVRDELGRTPLIAAATGGRTEIMKYLLAQGADPTARTYASNSLTQHYMGDFAGANAPEMADSSSQDKDGKLKGELLTETKKQVTINAIPEAASGGDLKSLKLLLSYQYPADEDGNILLLNVAKVLQQPFIRGAYHAMRSDEPEKFEFINCFGVKEDDTMSLDKLPAGQLINFQRLLERAARYGSIRCARLMIDKYGADPNQHYRGVHPLYTAAATNKSEIVRYLLEKYNVNIHLGAGRFATGPTALWIAIFLKSFDCVELLLRHGGPLEHIDDELLNVNQPVAAILIAQRGDRCPVRLETEENAQEYIKEARADWQTYNPCYVRLQIDVDDEDWITNLQHRKSDEELREKGKGARELNEKEAANLEDLDRRDPRWIMADCPTLPEREDELEQDDDLRPRWEPGGISASAFRFNQ